MIKRLALAVAAAALAGLAGPAFASDDGYENVFSSVLGAVGVLPGKDDGPEIDYRERAPLVLPPKQTLVTPQVPGATRTAAWPADPDIARRAKAAADARAPRLSGKNNDSLSKDEQLKYRAAQETQDPTESYRCSIHDKAICRITPEEEKAAAEKFKELNPDKGDTITAGVEPERVYLTQPPKGYLKATKTIKATHEAPEVKKDDSNPLTTYIQPAGAGKVDPLGD